MTNDLATLLQAPFPAEDIEWRVMRGWEQNGQARAYVAPYLTNRAIQDRLDDAVGPGNWMNLFKEWRGQGVLCGLSIRVVGGLEDPDTHWVTKWDGADETDIEPTKGGMSDSMKRAAVQWGIGRYLYGLGGTDIDAYKTIGPNGKPRYHIPDDWRPNLPAWALPAAPHSAFTISGQTTIIGSRLPPGAMIVPEEDEGGKSLVVPGTISLTSNTPRSFAAVWARATAQGLTAEQVHAIFMDAGYDLGDPVSLTSLPAAMTQDEMLAVLDRYKDLPQYVKDLPSWHKSFANAHALDELKSLSAIFAGNFKADHPARKALRGHYHQQVARLTPKAV